MHDTTTETSDWTAGQVRELQLTLERGFAEVEAELKRLARKIDQ